MWCFSSIFGQHFFYYLLTNYKTKQWHISQSPWTSFFFAHSVTRLHNTLTTHGLWSLVLLVISWEISLWNEQWSNRDFLPANIRSHWAFRSHISDAWSMKVARVMSRWDKPPQSCVLSVIWTCNGAERKGISITSFFCLSLCCNNILLLVHCFLDYGENVSSACWLSCEQPF